MVQAPGTDPTTQRTLETPPAAVHPARTPLRRASQPAAGEGPRDVRAVILAVVAAFVLVLGSFTWALQQQTRGRGGGVTQLSPGGEGTGLDPLPQAGGPPVTGGPRGQSGPGVTRVPRPETGGPSAVTAPQQPSSGPNVLASPSQPAGGPPVAGSPPASPQGPSLLQGPRGAPGGTPLPAAPQAPPAGPPVTAQPPNAPAGPSVATSPEQPPRAEPPREDISGYLRRLGQAESERRTLEARLITLVTNTTFSQALQALTSMNDGEDQAQFPMQALRDFELIARSYGSLAVRFQRYAPPVPGSCRGLHVAYANALSTMPRVVLALRNAILRRDAGAAVMVGQIANGSVNRHFEIADQELERVTRDHGIGKPYDLGSGGRGGLSLPFLP